MFYQFVGLFIAGAALSWLIMWFRKKQLLQVLFRVEQAKIELEQQLSDKLLELSTLRGNCDDLAGNLTKLESEITDRDEKLEELNALRETLEKRQERVQELEEGLLKSQEKIEQVEKENYSIKDEAAEWKQQHLIELDRVKSEKKDLEQKLRSNEESLHSDDELQDIKTNLFEEFEEKKRSLCSNFEDNMKQVRSIASEMELPETTEFFDQTMKSGVDTCIPKLQSLKTEVQELLHLVKIYERWHGSMSELKEHNQIMNELNEGLKEIGVQSRVLSVNAKIEAAKSGGAQGGFTVVAQEISNMSKSTQALCDTYSHNLNKNDLLITSTFQDVQAGSRMIMTAVDGIDTIVRELESTFDQIPETSSPSLRISEFLKKFEQLKESINQQQDSFL